MSFETITIERDERNIATLTLNRPEKHNSLSAQMISEITEACASFAADETLRAVVLTGAGESFCAGGDLNWMKAQFTATREDRIREAGKLAAMLGALNTLPQPLIGRVNGQAYGGGLGVIAVCDVAISAEGAKFGFTETRLGIIPATISPYTTARLGEGAARRVFMSARIFDAAEAVSLGLIAKAVPAAELDAAAEAEVKPYLSVAPGAVGRAKRLLRSLGPKIDQSVIDMSSKALADAWENAEAHEGVSAFLEKRKPAWRP